MSHFLSHFEKNNKPAVFPQEDMSRIGQLLCEKLKQVNLADYKKAMRQPVVKYDSPMWKFIKTQEHAVDVPDAGNALAVANFIIKLCADLPKNTSQPRLVNVISNDESQFSVDTEKFQVCWTQYTPVSEAEAEAIALSHAKCSVKDFTWRCNHQPGHKKTREIIARYYAKYPKCFKGVDMEVIVNV